MTAWRSASARSIVRAGHTWWLIAADRHAGQLQHIVARIPDYEKEYEPGTKILIPTYRGA